jgi:hypothetical protein
MSPAVQVVRLGNPKAELAVALLSSSPSAGADAPAESCRAALALWVGADSFLAFGVVAFGGAGLSG